MRRSRRAESTPSSATAEVASIERIRRWADLAEFCIDATERERVDVLVVLAEQLEAALEAAIAAERAA